MEFNKDFKSSEVLIFYNENIVKMHANGCAFIFIEWASTHEVALCKVLSKNKTYKEDAVVYVTAKHLHRISDYLNLISN